MSNVTFGARHKMLHLYFTIGTVFTGAGSPVFFIIKVNQRCLALLFPFVTSLDWKGDFVL